MNPPTTPNELFINASRKKMRFESNRGELAVEDLWDLSLEALNRIAISLDAKVTAAGTKSFINKRSASAAEDAAKLEIVVFVIDTKIADNEKAKARAERLSERAFLKNLLEKKRTETLEGLSAEEISARLAALGEEDEAAAA